MSLIHRAVLASFLRTLFTTLVGACVLFLLVDLFEHVDNFLDNHATLAQVGRYYLYKIPWVLDLCLPIAMLMAALFTVGSLARYNELMALFAAGRSLAQIVVPLLGLAVAASFFSLAWSEWVLPRANSARDHVYNVEIHRRPDRTRPTVDVAITGEDQRLYYARTYRPEQGEVTDLSVQTLRDASVVERLDAARAEWDGRQWVLFDGTRRIFMGDQESATPFRRLEAPFLSVTPEELNRERVRPDEMNVRQLARRVALLRRTGADATSCAVDLQFRLAFPWINLIVVALGVLLASGPRKTNVASGFGWTVMISFGYYLTMNLGRALGHSGALPPILAGWGGNFVYSGFATALWIRARR
jgi:lipopolysaccharide export system permease protein